MCGVFGILQSAESQFSGQELNQILARANLLLGHRGPDGFGTWVSKDGRVGLGHRRLAIMDPQPRSDQPFESRSGQTRISFNGEIYNFRELASAHMTTALQTRSDTEVLCELLEKKQERALPLLDGMFAFGCFRDETQSLLLAVDPAGEKPLYTYWDGQLFAFASEIKAFSAIPSFRFEILQERLHEYLIYGYVPGRKTHLKNVRRLLGGEYQIITKGHPPTTPSSYWNLPTGDKLNISYADAQVELRHLIRSAVKKRLHADVELGSFLSGGLDSSIVSYESQAMSSPQQLTTLCVSFHGDPESGAFDESNFARSVARAIHSRHIEVPVQSDNLDFEDLIGHFDEPFADSSALPTAALCRAARQNVKVALSGDGGDELFGGYLRFNAAIFSVKHARSLNIFSRLWPFDSKSHQGFAGYLSRLKRSHDLSLLEKLAHWNCFFNREDLREVHYQEALDFEQAHQGLSPGDLILHYNFKQYLFHDLLPKVDRMSMRFGVEVRAPFLDKQLIEFAFRLPTAYKFDSINKKRILKDLYRPILGSQIVDRKKHGFGFPLKSFFSNPQTQQALPNCHQMLSWLPDNLQAVSGRQVEAKKFCLWALENCLERQRRVPITFQKVTGYELTL